MDESSLSTVQDGQCKIVGQKGKKRIGAVTSQERGESVTCVVCMYAVGYFVPPMMIYKCKRNCHGAPPGCVFSCQEKCWMSNAGFVEWLKHFIIFQESELQRTPELYDKQRKGLDSRKITISDCGLKHPSVLAKLLYYHLVSNDVAVF